MKYLLDTCIISYFVRGIPNVLDKIKQTPPNQICVSTITVMEIEYGLELNPARAQKIEKVISAFLNNITIHPFTLEDASAAAAIRAHLQKQGTPISAYDILLAGSAMSRGLILVTANVSEFKRINGLLVENWVN